MGCWRNDLNGIRKVIENDLAQLPRDGLDGWCSVGSQFAYQIVKRADPCTSSRLVVHAPSQTGKTTTLQALAEKLTAEGKFAARHFSCKAGEGAGDDYEEAQRGLLSRIRREAEADLPSELRPPPFPETAATDLLGVALSAWARACPRPLVLLFDEIDALRGQSLISVLRQRRADYSKRPKAFPASVVLCGLRDLHDDRNDKAASGGEPNRFGTSSPFNVKHRVDASRQPGSRRARRALCPAHGRHGPGLSAGSS